MSIHHSSGEMDGIAVVYWWGGSSFWLLSYLTQIQWVQQSALILMGCFKVIFKVHLDLRFHHLPVKPMKYIDPNPLMVTGHLFHVTSFVFNWRAVLPKLALTSLRGKHHLIEEPISTDTGDWNKPTVCSVTLGWCLLLVSQGQRWVRAVHSEARWPQEKRLRELLWFSAISTESVHAAFQHSWIIRHNGHRIRLFSQGNAS